MKTSKAEKSSGKASTTFSLGYCPLNNSRSMFLAGVMIMIKDYLHFAGGYGLKHIKIPIILNCMMFKGLQLFTARYTGCITSVSSALDQWSIQENLYIRNIRRINNVESLNILDSVQAGCTCRLYISNKNFITKKPYKKSS